MGQSKNIFMEERNFPYPEPINKVSNCCGMHDKLDHESGTTYSEMDICPDCANYCRFLTEEQFGEEMRVEILTGKKDTNE